jgi:hypothetical protein
VSGGPLAGRVARLAAAVAWLGDPVWAERVAGLADNGGPPEPNGEPPTYGDIAGAGTDVVVGLADAGRWDEAAVEARALKRFFGSTPVDLGPIAVQAFDGLLAASLARDRGELEDFVDLVDLLFP